MQSTSCWTCTFLRGPYASETAILHSRGSLLRIARPLSLDEERYHLPGDEDPNQSEQGTADGTRDEGREAAATDEQRAAEVLFEHGAENETQDERSGIELEPCEHIAQEAERGGDVDVLQAVVDAIGPD